jgi:pimeloyl-ACP methyl ester carboxylesterase
MSSPSSADRYAAAAHATHRQTSAHPAGTLLLLHGLGGDHTQFDTFLPHLAHLPYDLLLPDMRAHGLTTLIGDPADFTFQQLSADIEALLRTRTIQPPLIGVGISMGAGVLATLAIQAPATFAGLVFIRPAWDNHPDPPHLRVFRTIADLLATRDVTAAGTEFKQSPAYRNVRAESETIANSLLDQFTAPHATERRIRLAYMPLSTPFTDLAHLQRIPTQAAVIATRHDPMHPIPIARSWADACRTALRIVPPRSIHNNRYATESTTVIAAIAGQADTTTSSEQPAPTRRQERPT